MTIKRRYRFAAYSLLLVLSAILVDRLPVPETGIAAVPLPPAHAEPPLPFKSDGCTLFPNQLLGFDFTPACVLHDYAYWQGGAAPLRKEADQALRTAIAEETGSLGAPLALGVYAGVRLFGDTWLTKLFDAHWGFGFDV